MTGMNQDAELLHNIRSRMPELTAQLKRRYPLWHYEDQMFRFYYRSRKVYYLQDETRQIVEALRRLGPAGTTFCPEFEEIIQEGTNVAKPDFNDVIQQGMHGQEPEMEYNRKSTIQPRHIVEAFIHARFFLQMAVKYGRNLNEAPELVSPGWAALLCLYNLR